MFLSTPPAGLLARWVAAALWLGLAGPGLAQAPADSARSLARRLDVYQRQTPQEKLFLHLDRPLYLSGEVMWFKVYDVDATYSRPLPLSTVAYVEVLDKNQRPVLQAKVPLKNATGQGSFQLPTSLHSGSYTVRAYTSWMQNFGPDAYFHSPVTIVNTFRASGVVSTFDTASYDVRFFPEGGNLVQALPGTVGFKITNRQGRGVAAEGTVLDAQGKAVASFRTLKFGMGSFSFTPTSSSPYTAVVKLPTGRSATYKLPAVYQTGYVLHLEEAGSGQLRLLVQASTPAAEPLVLLSHARQQPAQATSAVLQNGRAEFLVDKKQLADGITHFTLFNSRRQPLCERLYFQRPQRQLLIQARTDSKSYAARQKVQLQLRPTDPVQQAVPANLSVAVYRLDSLTAAAAPDISSYLWLASDLRGFIENPAYYLGTPNPEQAAATTNLLLTQGWSRFRWEEVLAPAPPRLAYPPELNGHLIRGRVTQRATGAPAPDITAYLASPGPVVRLNNSISGPDGSIQFEMRDFYDSRDIVVQTNTQRDSTYRVDILSPFSRQYAAGPFASAFMPYLRFKPDFTQHHLQVQVQNTYYRQHNNLYTFPTTDSLAFFGRPDEQYLLDDYTRFKVLEEVLREYVPGVKVRLRKDGFHFTVLDNPNRSVFTDAPLVLLDGVPVFNTNQIMAFDPLKIKKLEVLDSRYFQGRTMFSGIVSFSTYRGNMDGFQLDPRALVQEYEGLQLQREFYAPRYDTPQQQQTRLPDWRNLLYWNPEVATTSTGTPALDFYTGDQAGTYQVVVQGLSATGLAGSTSFTFEVTPAL